MLPQKYHSLLINTHTTVFGILILDTWFRDLLLLNCVFCYCFVKMFKSDVSYSVWNIVLRSNIITHFIPAVKILEAFSQWNVLDVIRSIWFRYTNITLWKHEKLATNMRNAPYIGAWLHTLFQTIDQLFRIRRTQYDLSERNQR